MHMHRLLPLAIASFLAATGVLVLTASTTGDGTATAPPPTRAPNPSLTSSLTCPADDDSFDRVSFEWLDTDRPAARSPLDAVASALADLRARDIDVPIREVHEQVPEGSDLWYGDQLGRVRLRQHGGTYVVYEALLCPAPMPTA